MKKVDVGGDWIVLVRHAEPAPKSSPKEWNRGMKGPETGGRMAN